jgi:hypothetical protein
LLLFFGRASGSERRICEKHYRATERSLSFELDDFYQKTDVTWFASEQCPVKGETKYEVCGIVKIPKRAEYTAWRTKSLACYVVLQ